MKVIVTSNNPVKLNSTLEGFNRMFPNKDFEVQGVDGVSGVSNQPMSDKETLTGALNRINNAFTKYPDADFWVGIEGGLEEKNGEMEVFAWVAIKSKDGQVGKGKTATFFLPKKITDLINQGMELGRADDIAFNQKNSKQKQGAVGILTGDIISRTDYYETAVIMALIPFKNKVLY